MANNWQTTLQKAASHLSKNDARLAVLISEYGECTIVPHIDYYGELIGSIVSQQLSVKAADTIWKRVLAVFEGKMPTPEQLLVADAEKLRACGVSYSKVKYMKDLAEHIIDGRLDMKHIATLPDNEVSTQLIAVKGIGEWSAHMFMIFSLGRLDVLPVGDLGIRKSIMQLYDLPELPDRVVIEALATTNNWHPYASVAAWYLWKRLDNKN